MCFSANASFGAGVVLSVIGVVSIKKAHKPSQLLFASIPLIFAVQQVAEGILWVTLPNLDNVATQRIATYTFLFFAQILWPLWVPVAIILLEKNSTRKKVQKILIGAGIIVGFYLAYCLLSYQIQAKIIGHHIAYIQNYPASLRIYVIGLYALATIAPPFFSHIKRMWMLGVAVLISYLITALFYEHYILSVWCFFSSIISISVYAIMIEISNSKQQIAPVW
ncbi:DUF6629 family protein [Runella sp.]|uniref:DUF6629 family protein n=1 Tax=Runella sp. TaxID=1960881 RepID=UPI0026280533|nr:DUF6629 family protein [Runella sp.]